MLRWEKWACFLILMGLLAGCGTVGEPAPAPAFPDQTPAEAEQPADSPYEIVTLLPPDAIPAIDDPQFLSVAEADEVYAAHELVLGVEINGDARAYSIPLLSGHEIVNDTVGDFPIAVTW